MTDNFLHLAEQPQSLTELPTGYIIHDNYADWISTPDKQQAHQYDFGSYWHTGNSTEGPYWRVSWVSTGELYARVMDTEQGHYVILAHISGIDAAKKLMGGWSNSNMNLYQLMRRIATETHGIVEQHS